MWSDDVRRRDGNRCVLCGSAENLNAHHIKPVALYPECKDDLDNGITLCRKCHHKIHGTFSSAGASAIGNLNPDPEGRLAAHREKIRAEQEERTRAMKGKHCGWRSTKENASTIIEAAKAAGQTPNEYITEAIKRRLESEGYTL